MRVTRAKICKAVFDKTGIECFIADYAGIYYWAGDYAIDHFFECCTHMVYLNDQTLEKWVADFEYKVEQGAEL